MGVPRRYPTGLEIGGSQQDGVIVSAHGRPVRVVERSDLAEQVAPKGGIAPAHNRKAKPGRLAVSQRTGANFSIEPGRVSGVEAARISQHKSTRTGVTESFRQLVDIKVEQYRDIMDGLRPGGVIVHHE